MRNHQVKSVKKQTNYFLTILQLSSILHNTSLRFDRLKIDIPFTIDHYSNNLIKIQHKTN